MQNKANIMWQLYLKEMHELRIEIMLVFAATVVTFSWFYLNYIETWQALFIAPFAITMSLSLFVPVISSFKLLSNEWKQNTIYLIMSLPVSGAMVLGSKLIAIISQFFIATGVVVLTEAFLLYKYAPVNQLNQVLQHQDAIIERLFYIVLMTVSFFVFIFCSSLLSQVIAKLNRKYSGIVSFVAFIAIVKIGSEVIHSTSSSQFQITLQQGEMFLNPALMFIGISIVLFIVAAYIYDHKLEL